MVDLCLCKKTRCAWVTRTVGIPRAAEYGRPIFHPFSQATTGQETVSNVDQTVAGQNTN